MMKIRRVEGVDLSMMNTSMTTMKVKQINKNKVYSFIYHNRTTCKLHITQQLQMGLSTVTQNLKLLETEGLICKNGFFESTGGRKADAIEIVDDARVAIGVAILQNLVQLVAINLYGAPRYTRTISVSFQPNDDYYQEIGAYIDQFVAEYHIPTEKILGVSIATQSIITKDGQSVSYGTLLQNSDMRLTDLQQFISYPCRLEHDSKAAARLELRNHSDVQEGIVLLLNRNMGGAIIADGLIQNGAHMRSGTIEHMCMNPEGALCYCGRRGCLETYCSANRLEETAMMHIPDFFRAMENGDLRCAQIWEEYLNSLAYAIRNLSVVIDGTFILSGYLAPYFTQEDIAYLLARVNVQATFPLDDGAIVPGASGQFTQAIGAALYDVDVFLRQI